MINFKSFSRLRNIFSRQNLFNSFKSGAREVKQVKLPSSYELLKITINNYSDFEKVIMVAIYHLINVQGSENEYLTVLTKDSRLISDLVKGDNMGVDIPENLKNENPENILVTCHNHFQKNIIPSSRDLNNIFRPNIKFTVIVSENQIGIIVNELGENFFKLDKNEKEIFLNTWKSYYDYIIFCLNQVNPKEVLKYYLDENLDEKTKQEFQDVYDEFVGKNIEKFVDEFNIRFKKYNIYYVHIIV